MIFPQITAINYYLPNPDQRGVPPLKDLELLIKPKRPGKAGPSYSEQIETLGSFITRNFNQITRQNWPNTLSFKLTDPNQSPETVAQLIYEWASRFRDDVPNPRLIRNHLRFL